MPYEQRPGWAKASAPANDNAPAGANGRGVELDTKQSKGECPARSTKQQGLRTINLRERLSLGALNPVPLTRENLDRTAGATNSPDLAMNVGRDPSTTVPCDPEVVRDRDGILVRRGVYRLAAAEKTKARTARRGGAA